MKKVTIDRLEIHLQSGLQRPDASLGRDLGRELLRRLEQQRDLAGSVRAIDIDKIDLGSLRSPGAGNSALCAEAASKIVDAIRSNVDTGSGRKEG